MNPVAVILMIKNEQDAIQVTSPSLTFFDHLFVLDTGSTDQTIPTLYSITKKHNISLHLKHSSFISFPHSRNEAIEFAETFCKLNLEHIKYFLLIDAADIFKTNFDKSSFIKNINSIPPQIAFGIVKQSWLDKDNMLSDHFDIRFISIRHSLRYDLDIPVHEQFKNVHLLKSINFADMFFLFQNRTIYAASTELRFDRDILILSDAKPTKRNLYFLAQSYMSINDFKNGFKFNILSYETQDPLSNNDDFDQKFTIVRIAFCAMQIKLNPKIIIKYLNIVLATKEPPIDAFIYIIQVYINTNQPNLAIPYIQTLFQLEKPSSDSTTQLVNHSFYDYTRYHLISVICLMTKQHLNIGKIACIKAINHFGKEIDKNNFLCF